MQQPSLPRSLAALTARLLCVNLYCLGSGLTESFAVSPRPLTPRTSPVQSIGKDKWPKCGGSNGSIRFDPEIKHGANAGLPDALALIEHLSEKYPEVGYADMFQLASATAVEVRPLRLLSVCSICCFRDPAHGTAWCRADVGLVAVLGGGRPCEAGGCVQEMGGPKIPMRYGRKDASGPDMCHPEGNLPGYKEPFPEGGDAANHLRTVFHRMGLTDEDIVALSGAHTVGRAHAARSGANHKAETKYTAPGACPMGTGTPGGASWTPEWVKFDNSYFKLIIEKPDPENLMVLPTDEVLLTDSAFKCAPSPGL